MRVAQVLCAGSYAGAEAVATRLCLALRGRVDASILYVVRELRAGRSACDKMVAQIDATGVDRRVFDVDRRLSPSLVRDLRAALERDRIDVLHAHAYKIATQLPLIRRQACLSATVFTAHGLDQSHWRGRLFLETMTLMGAYAADRLVCVSDPLAAHFQAYPALGSRICVIGNAAPACQDQDWLQLLARRHIAAEALRATHGLRPEAVPLVAVGRLIPVKNLALLLDALHLLERIGCSNHVELIVVGDGPLRADLEAHAAGGAVRVHFVGAIADPTHYYLGCAALVLSSDSEGSPMVVLEALAHGLPVVARAVGGVGDIVRDGIEGLLVHESTAEALAWAIERVVSDLTLCDQLGRRAWERARTELSPDAWGRRHLCLYEEILAMR